MNKFVKSCLLLGICLAGFQLGTVSTHADDQVGSSADTAENGVNNDYYEQQKKEALDAGFTLEQFEQIMKIPNLESEDIISEPVDPNEPVFIATPQQEKVVSIAKNQIGKPYKYGAEGPNSFDCGGLVRYSYRHGAGMDVSMGTYYQEKLGKEVNMGALQLGDLLFWGARGSTYHVAIYIGNGQYVHAPEPGQNVKIGNVSYSGFKPSFARRLLSDTPVKKPNNNGQKANERYIFRLYNPNAGHHHYTQITSEAISLQSNGWIYEGVGWAAPDKGSPVYRVYNPNNGIHHYTLNVNERNHLVKVGWKNEGTSWNSGGSVPVYRVYNPNAKGSQDSHHYTTNIGERNNLVKLGWRNEGIAWYAIRTLQ